MRPMTFDVAGRLPISQRAPVQLEGHVIQPNYCAHCPPGIPLRVKLSTSNAIAHETIHLDCCFGPARTG